MALLLCAEIAGWRSGLRKKTGWIRFARGSTFSRLLPNNNNDDVKKKNNRRSSKNERKTTNDDVECFHQCYVLTGREKDNRDWKVAQDSTRREGHENGRTEKKRLGWTDSRRVSMPLHFHRWRSIRFDSIRILSSQGRGFPDVKKYVCTCDFVMIWIGVRSTTN